MKWQGTAGWAIRKALLHAALGFAAGLGLTWFFARPWWGGRLAILAAVALVMAVVGALEAVHIHRGQPVWKSALDFGTWLLASLLGAFFYGGL